MVTLPSEAATDYALVRGLVGAGMDCARINCAHDDHDAWVAMTEHVRRASDETSRSCKLYFDIAGPKVRTAQVAHISADTRVYTGDRVAIVSGGPAASAEFPVAFSCSVPEVLRQIEPGQTVWIDDGKIGCVVESVGTQAGLRVTTARPRGERIRPDKGLNFPDSTLRIGALTSKDIEDLRYSAGVADILGYSFVREPEDVNELQQTLHTLTPRADRITIALKIENARAVHNLPELIVAVASRQPAAVMIARGDLAVEIGYRRLAEMQEELLWLCEAAHVPVIWATQVLDRFIKKGVPSRAEFTDAAMAERADCVMLNKGPFVTEAVTVLADVLGRMEGHQMKKTSRLRALHSW
ncbi:MAG: pyruvate kinase [Vulcanimicrobiaceae bacterium]